jgi:hypothetical protein
MGCTTNATKAALQHWSSLSIKLLHSHSSSSSLLETLLNSFLMDLNCSPVEVVHCLFLDLWASWQALIWVWNFFQTPSHGCCFNLLWVLSSMPWSGRFLQHSTHPWCHPSLVLLLLPLVYSVMLAPLPVERLDTEPNAEEEEVTSDDDTGSWLVCLCLPCLPVV